MNSHPGSLDDSDLPDDIRDRVFVAYYSPTVEERDAAIAQLCREHSDSAEAIHQQVATLVRADEMLGVIDLPVPEEHPSIPEQLGDYSLEQQIGSGGMGIVFLATQAALHRRVAIKVVRPERLPFEGARQRFHREVTAVGRLAHFGIAAVYDIGEHAGLPYIVMEAVPGISLAQLIAAARSRPTPPRTGREMSDILNAHAPTWAEPGSDEHIGPGAEFFSGSWSDVAVRIGRELAMALHHAHERGIVHRDIKPSNVLITAEGRVVLIDFGLARVEDAGDLTRTGTALGSFNYMSPEQVQRQPVDLRTDVYSAGLTILELLTLRPAFAGDDPIAIRDQILRGIGTHARASGSTVSTDLATVCAVAAELEPARRYPTAGALARDLDRVVAGIPIRARPVSWSRKTWRWVHRNRANTVAAITTALLVVGGPILLWQNERAANRELLRQRERADAGLLAAADAVERLLSQMSTRIADLPHLTGVRAGMLREALAILDELAGKFDETGRLHGFAAGAALNRGRILLLLRQNRESLLALGDAERLVQRTPDERERLRVLAQVRAAQSVGRFNVGELSVAAELAQDARERLEAILAADPHDQLIADLLTGHLSHTAAVQLAMDQPTRSRKLLDESVARREEQLRRDGPDYDNKLALARELRQRGHVAARTATTTEARAAASSDTERSIALLREAHRERPGDPFAPFYLAAALGDRAQQHKRSGDRSTALTLRRESLALREQLVRDFPTVALYASECAAALHNVALALEVGDPERPDLLLRAIALQRRALADGADDRRFLRYLFKHFVALSDEWRRLGDHEQLADCASWMLDEIQLGFNGPFDASMLFLDAARIAAADPSAPADLPVRLRDRALAALARAAEHGVPAQYLKNPAFDPVRSDPRFAESASIVERAAADDR